MGTVFRVGMEVYDQVNNPNKKGKILDIKEDEICHKIHSYDYPIEVQFEGKDDLSYYDLEGCPVWSSNPTLSTSPYTLQGFEQKAPVPEFYEALGWLENNKNYKTVIRDERTYPSMEIYKAFEALRKLIILRDFYNEGWQPDWSKENWKYSILLKCVHPIIDFGICDSAGIPHVLSFKTRSIAEKFLKEQKELLITARFLL